MDNLTTTQKLYEAFGQGDIPGILDLCADDVAWEHWEDNRAQQAGVPTMQRHTGKAGAAEFFGHVGSLSMQSFEVLNLMAGGNQVAVTFVIEYGTPVGGHIRDEEIHLWTFNAAGQISALRHYTDTAKHIAGWTV